MHAGLYRPYVHALYCMNTTLFTYCECIQASIETIIESEDQVKLLMGKLDDALVEVGVIEQNLNDYAFLLNSVRSTTEKTDMEFRHVMVEDRNLFELREALADLVVG